MNLNLKKESLRKVNETLQSIDRKSNKRFLKFQIQMEITLFVLD